MIEIFISQPTDLSHYTCTICGSSDHLFGKITGFLDESGKHYILCRKCMERLELKEKVD